MEQDWAALFDAKVVDFEPITQVRAVFKEAASKLQGLLPQSRYRSLVLTKLEEAAMHATKALTHG